MPTGQSGRRLPTDEMRQHMVHAGGEQRRDVRAVVDPMGRRPRVEPVALQDDRAVDVEHRHARHARRAFRHRECALAQGGSGDDPQLHRADCTRRDLSRRVAQPEASRAPQRGVVAVLEPGLDVARAHQLVVQTRQVAHRDAGIDVMGEVPASVVRDDREARRADAGGPSGWSRVDRSSGAFRRARRSSGVG